MMETRFATPLQNLRIIWTGSQSSAQSLLDAVKEAGARVFRCPLIEFAPPSDPRGVERVLRRLDRFAWILFTSQQAVRQVLHLPPPSARVAAVGPASADLLESHGWTVHLSSAAHSARDLGESLTRGEPAPAGPVLFLRGDKALPTLPATLSEKGWIVEELEVYRSLPVSRESAREVARAIASTADVVIVGSPTGVDTLSRAVPDGDISSINRTVQWLALGTSTFNSLKAAGVPQPLRLDSVTPECLVSTLSSAFGHRTPQIEYER